MSPPYRRFLVKPHNKQVQLIGQDDVSSRFEIYFDMAISTIGNSPHHRVGLALGKKQPSGLFDNFIQQVTFST